MEEPSTSKPKILGSTSAGIDRISDLPDDVLHHILSSLHIFDVFQLGLLSKRWEYIWVTMPYLHFDIYRLYAERPTLNCDLAMAEKLKDFINWVLISRSSTRFVRFFLLCGGFFNKVAILRWIRAAAKRNVQELVLSFCLGEPFELPYCLVTCESLQVLRLRLSAAVLKLPNHLGFRQLKFLHLVEVELSGEHGGLFSKCHLLERLILEDCSLGAMTLFHIASTSLINVTLRGDVDHMEGFNNCEVKISCPNLKFLKYTAPFPKDIIFENLVSIEAVHFYFYESSEEVAKHVHKMIKEVSSTSILKLCGASVWGLYKAADSLRLSPVLLYKLKYLRMHVNVDEYFMQSMITLLKSSPNLEVLKLWLDEDEVCSENPLMPLPDKHCVLGISSKVSSVN